MEIVRNRIKCNTCGQIIESYSVHDFKFCECESCAVDGGHDYLRRLGYEGSYTEMSIIRNSKGEEVAVHA